MKTFVLGSDHPGDQLAWDVCEELGIEAELTTQFSDILPWLEVGKAMVIDVARGIEAVQQVSAESLKSVRTVTAHDFDFATEMKLALSANLFLEENLVLVGIPLGMEKEEAKKVLGDFLSSFQIDG